MQAGDLVLCHGTGPVDRLIQGGQLLRYRWKYARWNHVAFTINPHQVIEAVGAGVQVSEFGSRASHRDHRLLPMHLHPTAREKAILYLQSCLGERYGWTEIAGAVLFLASGSRVAWAVPKQAICSALVAEALAQAQVPLPCPPDLMLPADLARAFLPHKGRVPAQPWR